MTKKNYIWLFIFYLVLLLSYYIGHLVKIDISWLIILGLIIYSFGIKLYKKDSAEEAQSKRIPEFCHFLWNVVFYFGRKSNCISRLFG